MIGFWRPVGARDVEQGRKPRTAPLAHDGEPLDDKRAVQARQRRDVSDGRERDEIERGDEVGGSGSVPEPRLAQRPAQRDERHVDDARGRQIAETGKIVLTVGIDERKRPRQALRGLVMVEHDHVEAEPDRELERLVADRAAIDGDDERRAVRRKTRDRFAVRAITLSDAIGDVDDRFAPAGGQIFAEQRRAAGAVDVVVAEDRNPFAALDCALEAVCGRLHVPEAKWVRHQVAQGRIEIALHSLRRDAAPREHAREEFVLPADLRDGESAGLARAVQARAPRAAERRALDVKKVIGGYHRPALIRPRPRRVHLLPQAGEG